MPTKPQFMKKSTPTILEPSISNWDSSMRWMFSIVGGLVLWATILLHLKLGKVYFGVKGVLPAPTLAEIGQNAALLFRHFQGGFARTLSGYGSFALIAVSILAVGRWVEERVLPTGLPDNAGEISTMEKLSLRYLLGSLVFSLLWLVLGQIGGLNWWTAGAVTFLGCAGFAAQIVLRPRTVPAAEFVMDSFPGRTGLAFTYRALAAVGILWLVLFSVTSVLAPQQADTLITHIALPSYYINMGKVAFNPNHFHSYFPENTEMLVMWALLFKSEVAATLLMWGFYAAFIFLIWGFLKRCTDPLSATAATLVALSIPNISNAAMTIKNDMPVSVFLVANFWTLTECMRRPAASKRWALLAGILGGAAIGHKLTALSAAGISAGFLMVYDLYQKKKSRPSILSVLYVGGVLLAAAPWFLRTFLETGNPIYPFLNSIFNSSLGEFAHQSVESKFYVDNQGWLSLKSYLVSALWGQTILNLPLWGPSLVFGLLAIPIIVGKFPSYFRISVGLALASFLALIVSSIEMRFHIGLLSFLVFVPLALYLHIFLRSARWPFLCAALGILLFCIYDPLRNTFQIVRSSLHVMVSGNMPGNVSINSVEGDDVRWMAHLINTRTKPTEKVLYAGIAQAYGLDRRFWYSSGFGKELIGQLAEASAGPAELRARIRGMGVSHILIKSSFFDDFERHQIVEARIAPGDLQKIKLFLDTYMVLHFVSPDRMVLWYAFKEDLLPQVVLDAHDAELYPAKFVEEARAQIDGGKVDIAKIMLLDGLRATMSFINKFQVYKYLAASYGAAGDKGKQEETLNSAIELFPDQAEFYYDLAVFHYLGGRLQTSLDLFRKVIKLSPDYFEAYNNIGSIFLIQKDYPSALEYFKWALEINPGDRTAAENIRRVQGMMKS